ncbi:MAG: response regulator, partial [Verrucomicrobiota bacterium]
VRGNVTLRAFTGRDSSDAEVIRFEIEDSSKGFKEEEVEAFIGKMGESRLAEDFDTSLTLVRHLVEGMGGSLQSQCPPQGGVLMTVVLPYRKSENSKFGVEAPLGRVKGVANQESCRVLVVDDQFDNRRLLCCLLQRVGISLREAEDGEEALKIFQDWEPDLIFMDLDMPIMNGYEATRVIKDSESGQRTPVIALTANTFEQDRMAAMNAGCDDFISKPYSPEELFEKLAQFTGVELVREEAMGEVEEEVEPEVEAPIQHSVVDRNGEPLIDEQTLDALPLGWLEQLERAAGSLNTREIDGCLKILAEHDPFTSSMLGEWAEAFDFDRIARYVMDVRGSIGPGGER